MAREQHFRRNRRKPPHIPTISKILIVCEGEKTEYEYFKAVSKNLGFAIDVRHSRGTDPLNIVKTAISIREEKIMEESWIKGDEAWAVFDGDEHKDRDLQNWTNAIKESQTNKINLAITNPCFEFWYLIHFQDSFGHITCADSEAHLKKHILNYAKNRCFYPRPLMNYTHAAIERAIRIEEQAKREQLKDFSNPCCLGVANLHKIFLALKELKDS